MLSDYAHRNDLAFANTVCDSSELGDLHAWGGYRKVNVVPRQIDYIMASKGLWNLVVDSEALRLYRCKIGP